MGGDVNPGFLVRRPHRRGPPVERLRLAVVTVAGRPPLDAVARLRPEAGKVAAFRAGHSPAAALSGYAVNVGAIWIAETERRLLCPASEQTVSPTPFLWRGRRRMLGQPSETGPIGQPAGQRVRGRPHSKDEQLIPTLPVLLRQTIFHFVRHVPREPITGFTSTHTVLPSSPQIAKSGIHPFKSNGSYSCFHPHSDINAAHRASNRERYCRPLNIVGIAPTPYLAPSPPLRFIAVRSRLLDWPRGFEVGNRALRGGCMAGGFKPQPMSLSLILGGTASQERTSARAQGMQSPVETRLPSGSCRHSPGSSNCWPRTRRKHEGHTNHWGAAQVGQRSNDVCILARQEPGEDKPATQGASPYSAARLSRSIPAAAQLFSLTAISRGNA